MEYSQRALELSREMPHYQPQIIDHALHWLKEWGLEESAEDLIKTCAARDAADSGGPYAGCLHAVLQVIGDDYNAKNARNAEATLKKLHRLLQPSVEPAQPSQPHAGGNRAQRRADQFRKKGNKRSIR